jgi:hypothetical protein
MPHINICNFLLEIDQRLESHNIRVSLLFRKSGLMRLSILVLCGS